LELHKETILQHLDFESFYRNALPSFQGTGKQKKAFCPFHADEKTPSLSINTETGAYNCFGCGKGGDVIRFVQESRGLDFNESLQHLSDLAGLSHSAKGKGSDAKSSKPASQNRAESKNKGKGDTQHSFTMDSIKNRTLKGGYAFSRHHVYPAADPEYLKVIYKTPEGEKQARFYTLTDKNKGLYIDKRTARPVLFNQHSLKEPSGPVIYCEGEKDVDTLTALNFIAVTAGAVNDWRSEFAQSFKGIDVVIIPDNDAPGKKHADMVRASLNGIAASVKILTLPGLPDKGDVSDYIEERRKQGKTDEAIRLELQALMEAAPISEGHWLSLPEGWPYFVDDNGIGYWYKTKKGDSVPAKLCNFDAGIVEEVCEDDGTDQSRHLYLIEGRRGKIKLNPIEVLHSKFESLSWHRQWGAMTVVEPGTSVKDKLRHAVETRSPHRKTRRVYTHTGWRQIGGKMVYLTSSGGIGAEGIEVRLQGELKRYRVPLQPENESEAIKASLDFLRVGRPEITLPLFLMSYLAPLTSTLTPMFSGYVFGERDTYKTSLAVLALSHFGNFMDKVGLQNFSSSAGSLERTSFLLKDALTVIDDFFPSASPLDAQKMQKIVQDVIRSTGNRTGRGRLTPDATLKETSYPRGMVILTGEKLPSVQSTRTRTLTVEIKRGDLQLDRLSNLQQRAGLLPHAMSSFIHWLRDNLEWIEEEKSQQIEHFRKEACKENSFKLAEHISMLQYTSLLVCNWLVAKDAISGEKAAEMHDESWRILLNLSREHRQLIENEDPVKKFIEILQALQIQGKIRIANKYLPDKVEIGNINGEIIGYCDDDNLYLHPEPLMQSVKIRCRAIGSEFPIDDTSLFKALKNRGMTRTDPDRVTRKVRLPGSEGPIRVLQLNRDMVFPRREVITEDDNVD
jgi:hypothetical protein